MLVSCVLQCKVFLSFYRFSWPLVVFRTCPMVLCHVSWDLATFAWIMDQHSELQNVYGFIRIHQNVVVFIRILFLGSHGWMSDVFMGSSYEPNKFMCLSMSIVLHKYFRMFLDNSLCKYVLGTCVRERKVELSLQAHVLGDFAHTEQHLLPYVSNFNWIRLELAFCFCFFFFFSPTVLVC